MPPVDVDQIEKMRCLMQQKLASIPEPSSQAKNNSIQRNIDLNNSNLEHTKKILQERRMEAEQDGDIKKKMHSIVIEKSQMTQCNNHNKIIEIKTKMEHIKKMFSESDWKILSQFSEINNPSFWNKTSEYGYNDTTRATYYRDVWGIKDMLVPKFIEYLKLHKQLKEIEINY